MFGLNKLKMKNEELERENTALREALDLSNKANRELSTMVQKISKDFNEAVERVIYLANQIKLKDAQKQASTKYSDDSKN